MKHENLVILKQNGINVPNFIMVENIDDYTPVKSFLLSDNKLYAVRSSFAYEDGKKHSFAGQFETLLNVKKENIKEALEIVFASMDKQELPYDNLTKTSNNAKSCVIIQEMINADYSGVIFTANPIGILNEIVITIGEGVGNNVVEDKIPTTSYFYNRNDKTYRYEKQDNAPLINKEKLDELVSLSNKIKNIFRYEADIEFAIKDNNIYILQARPITTIKTENAVILDNSNIAESYPGITLPLTQDFVKDLYHKIFYNCLVRTTKSKAFVDNIDIYLKDMVDAINWRMYYRLNNWYIVLRLLPFSNKIIGIWQKMLGVNSEYAPHSIIKTPFKIKLSIIHSFITLLRDIPKLMDKLNSDFKAKYSKYRKMIEENNSVVELLKVYNDIKTDILKDWDLTLVNDMYAFIYTFLSGKRNEKYIANIKNLESLKPVMYINNLIETANVYGFDSKDYNDAIKDYIEEYGDRCLGELKLETHTYRSHPNILTEYIKNQSEVPAIENKTPTATSKNLFVKRAKRGIENREISRMNRSRLFGLGREIFRKIGNILVMENKIENIDDIFYLHISELQQTNINLKQIIFERKNKEKAFENMPTYNRLVITEDLIGKEIPFSSETIVSIKDEMKGIPTSIGKVIGEVIIIDKPDDKINTEGKILVTKSTDPGWVFLIRNAAGIIAEQGSLLSHTAIISRELHKPAVVNVKNCTNILNNGDIVELDANTGTIKIIRRKHNG